MFVCLIALHVVCFVLWPHHTHSCPQHALLFDIWSLWCWSLSTPPHFPPRRHRWGVGGRCGGIPGGVQDSHLQRCKKLSFVSLEIWGIIILQTKKARKLQQILYCYKTGYITNFNQMLSFSSSHSIDFKYPQQWLRAESERCKAL